jgi:hypothetical protein
MKAVQNLLLAAFLAVLALIAYDLHRLVNTISPGGATMTALFGAPDDPKETRAQRNERLRRETDELSQDFMGALGMTKPAPRAVKPKSDLLTR